MPPKKNPTPRRITHTYNTRSKANQPAAPKGQYRIKGRFARKPSTLRAILTRDRDVNPNSVTNNPPPAQPIREIAVVRVRGRDRRQIVEEEPDSPDRPEFPDPDEFFTPSYDGNNNNNNNNNNQRGRQYRDLNPEGLRFSPPSSPDGPVIHHVAFFVTINTNQRPKNQEHLTMIDNQLKRVTKAVFEDADYSDFIQDKANENIPPQPVDDNDIISMKVDSATERGTHPKGGRIHIHCWMRITHKVAYPGIQLNLLNLRATFRELMGMNCYINVTAGSNPASIMEYLLKGVGTKYNSGLKITNPDQVRRM